MAKKYIYHYLPFTIRDNQIYCKSFQTQLLRPFKIGHKVSDKISEVSCEDCLSMWAMHKNYRHRLSFDDSAAPGMFKFYCGQTPTSVGSITKNLDLVDCPKCLAKYRNFQKDLNTRLDSADSSRKRWKSKRTGYKIFKIFREDKPDITYTQVEFYDLQSSKNFPEEKFLHIHLYEPDGKGVQDYFWLFSEISQFGFTRYDND